MKRKLTHHFYFRSKNKISVPKGFFQYPLYRLLHRLWENKPILKNFIKIILQKFVFTLSWTINGKKNYLLFLLMFCLNAQCCNILPSFIQIFRSILFVSNYRRVVTHRRTDGNTALFIIEVPTRHFAGCIINTFNDHRSLQYNLFL